MGWKLDENIALEVQVVGCLQTTEKSGSLNKLQNGVYNWSEKDIDLN